MGGQARGRFAAQHHAAAGKPAAQLHETQGHKAVEPGIGGLFHHLLKAAPGHILHQFLALQGKGTRKSLTAEDGHIPGNLRGQAVFFRDAQRMGAGGDGLDEIPAGGGSVLLDGGSVHGEYPLRCDGVTAIRGTPLARHPVVRHGRCGRPTVGKEFTQRQGACFHPAGPATALSAR